MCNGDVLALLEHSAIGLLTGMTKNTLPLALLEARWLAPFECTAFLRQSFDKEQTSPLTLLETRWLAPFERVELFRQSFDKEQTSPLTSLEARWLASFERAALLCQSFDNASLAVAMALGIKATLLCAHGPTVLTNPEPCSADFLSAFVATRRIQDAYPCPHVMT